MTTLFFTQLTRFPRLPLFNLVTVHGTARVQIPVLRPLAVCPWVSAFSCESGRRVGGSLLRAAKERLVGLWL